ncbi:MAG: hypothetical protein GY816_05295 [Cytophagales bacterium]|nr:hypothetical protein [Cytophagales bacterium]
MKNFTTVLTIALTFTLLRTQAQIRFEWSDGGVGLEMTEDFEVIENTDEAFEFTRTDNQITITVKRWLDVEISPDDLEETTYWYAVDNVFGDSLDGQSFDSGCLKIELFDVCYIIGAMDNGDSDYYLVALLLDIDSETHAKVSIAFTEGNKDIAVGMLKSFFSFEI